MCSSVCFFLTVLPNATGQLFSNNFVTGVLILVIRGKYVLLVQVVCEC